MRGDDLDRQHGHGDRFFSQIAVVACVVAVVLSLRTWLRTSPAELRWIAPLAAAALIVALAATGARLELRPRSPAARHASLPAGWMLFRAAWWRDAMACAYATLRGIRWWPWCVMAGALLTLLLCAATWFVFDRRPSSASAASRTVMMLACGATLALAFGILVVERLLAASAGASRGNAVVAGALRIALAASLSGAACAALDAWFSVDARWLAYAIALLSALIAVEFAGRALFAWFSPPAASAAALPLVDSAFVHALLHPRASPAEVGESLRRRYGIDLRQSWVVHSTLRMLPAAGVALLGLAWLLSGITILQPDQRAVYERFGAPVAVWQPGLHAGLPWPLGVARAVDNGAVHQLIVSAAGRAEGTAAPQVAADARTPEQLDRLWDVAHPWETSQVIASGTGRQQNFEVVNADVRLDYRIGPSDAAARAALYRSTDLPEVVRAIADREVVRYLASHTLDQLIEVRQTVMADSIRRSVQRQLDALDTGIDVLAVVIESVHPPAGASAAWHGVQAAQIRATASIAQARGLAAGLIGSANQQAQASVAGATAKAAETLSAARAQQTSFDADIAAQQAGGRAFAFEYYLHNLQTGLQNANITVIDDRLVSGNRATIDLRQYGAGDVGGVKRVY